MTTQRPSRLPATLSTTKVQQLTDIPRATLSTAIRTGRTSPLRDGEGREIRPGTTESGSGATLYWPTYRIIAGLGMSVEEARLRLGLDLPQTEAGHPAPASSVTAPR